MSPLLQPFGERIWVCDGPRVKMMTIPFTTRMTIVALDDDGLWLHSPIEPTPEVLEAVDALGNVEYIVAPNKIHSLGVGAWRERYPSAEVWVSPGFLDRHPDARVDHVIGAVEPVPWDDQIECLCFDGSTIFDEVVFFHAVSGTLIFTDLLQRHDPAGESWFWRVVKRAAGVLGHAGGTARDLRATFGDRGAARASAEALLRWDFDRVTVAHGFCITHDARHTVKRALDWALQ